MKHKLLIGISLVLFAGCGSRSPEAYAKASARITCRTVKKCEKAAWNDAGYDSVRDCVDDLASKSEVDAFVDFCQDFDKKSARKCLRAARKARRTCEEQDEPACLTVCGDLTLPGELTPQEETEFGRRMSEWAYASGEIDLDETAESDDDLDGMSVDDAFEAEIDAIMADED